MQNWANIVWALVWASLFMITVVGCCRAVGSHAARRATPAEVRSPGVLPG